MNYAVPHALRTTLTNSALVVAVVFSSLAWPVQADADLEAGIAYYRAVSEAMAAHSCVITAFYENESEFLTLDGQGAHDRRKDIDQLTAEMLRLSKLIMPEQTKEEHDATT